MKAILFIELVPKWRGGSTTRVIEVRPGRTSTKESTARGWGTRYAKVSLDVPAALFLPPQIEVEVSIEAPVCTAEATAT